MATGDARAYNTRTGQADTNRWKLPVMTGAPRPLVAGNWKMNGVRAGAVALAAALVERAAAENGVPCDVLACPPAPQLFPVLDVVAGSPIALGGQDCHARPDGAHTGDVGAGMLADAGCAYVIVGHSERRAGHGETDSAVREKAAAARRAGLVPIVCVGETEAQREAGRALRTVTDQLGNSVPDGAGASNTVIAYEPVWAIGTGRTPAPEEIREVHGAMRRLLAERFGPGTAALRLLYGGSVNPGNAAEIASIENVDGALVGGASLKAETFWPIVRAFGRGGPDPA